MVQATRIKAPVAPADTKAAGDYEEDEEDEEPTPIVNIVHSGGQKDAVKITSVDVEGAPGQRKVGKKRHDEAPNGGIFIVNGKRVNHAGQLVNETGKRVKGNGEAMTDAEELEELRAMKAINPNA